MSNIPAQRTPAEFLDEALKAIDDSRRQLTVDAFRIERPIGMQPADRVIWHRDSEVIETINDTGDDYGRVLVRLCVDAEHDLVESYAGQTSDIETLERAITAMQEVRDVLVGMGHGGTRGRCMATGDWGRCTSPTGHDLPHAFPTEKDWRADFEALNAARAKREAVQ